MTETEELTWVGLKVGNFLIDAVTSDGPFSWVYRGTNLDGGPDAAFKVAKPKHCLENIGDTIERTQAMTIFEGGVADVTPDTREILLAHFDKMQECHHPALITIDSIVDDPETCFLQMEFLDGLTLRDTIKSSEVSIETFIDIACHLDELSKTTYEYHGDLRPDNILITASGIKLADTGYFGILNCEEGPDLDCVVTNGFYYPCLEPNDRMAFGIILWEAAIKSHPLQSQQTSHIVGKSLDEWISAYEEMGQYFLSPLRNIQRPTDTNPDLDPAVEEIIFHAMGLKVIDGLVERSADEVGYQELIASLNKIKDLKL